MAGNNCLPNETTENSRINDLESELNNFGGRFETGLQQLLDMVSGLRREHSDFQAHIRNLADEISHVSAERDHYQQTVITLEKETSAVKAQLADQNREHQRLKEETFKCQKTYQDQLDHVAGWYRQNCLARRALHKWRNHHLEAQSLKSDAAVHLQLMQDENLLLKEELLKYQESTKQAFLRSANALNSEAMSLFQDAASRRLEYLDEQESNSPLESNRFSRQVDEQVISPVKMTRHGEREDTLPTFYSQPDRDQHLVQEEPFVRQRAARMGERDDTLPPTEDHLDVHRLIRSQSWQEEHPKETYQSARSSGQPTGSSGHKDSWSSQKQSSARWTQPPDPAETLQRETRARLQQLRDESLRRPANPHHLDTEPVAKLWKSVPNTIGTYCRCGSHERSAETRPYRCPYCTPVDNSNHNHSKTTYIKPQQSAVRKSQPEGKKTLISTTFRDDRKNVIYKPCSSNVVVEKHVSRS